MDTLKEMNDRIVECQGVMDNTHAEIYTLRLRRAELTCPFNVGECTPNKRGIDFEITRIEAGSSSCYWAVFGRQVKKNGNLGVQERELYSWKFPAIRKAQNITEKGA